MVEAISDEYKQEHKETRLIPYIRVALQLDMLYDLSTSEQEQYSQRLLKKLLQDVDTATLTTIEQLVEPWPPRCGLAWTTRISSLRSSA